MLNELKKNSDELKREVRERTVSYIVGALGLVAGLAWNEAIRALIDAFFPASSNGLVAKFLYAIMVTVFVVVVSMYLVRTAKEHTNTT